MTTQPPASIAEALDAGIAAANAGGAPPLPPADDDNGGTPDDSQTVSADADGTGTEGSDEGATGVDDGAPDGTEGAGKGDGTDPADGAAPDDSAEGEGAAQDGTDPEGVDPKTGKPATKAKPGEPGDTDPITAPIPNALKKETKERIRTLAGMAKEEKTRADTATSERDELINAVTSTGASPEQYAGMLDYLELVNSGDQNKLKQAAQFMFRELSALSRVGGFRIPGITSYAGHKDLEDGVKAGSITEALAEELAASRAATAHQGKIGAAQHQAAKAQQEYRQAEAAARAEMNVLEAEFSKDPMYAQKKPIIVGMLNEMIRGDKKAGVRPLHPSKWLAAYKKLYQTLPNTFGTPAPRQAALPGRVPQNQPLRTQQPAGAQKPEPKSVAEALDMGIELARGA